MSAATPAPKLDRRLAPTAGVWRLIGETLVDLVLLPARVLHAVVTARRRKAEMSDLILGRAHGSVPPPMRRRGDDAA